MSEPVYWSLMDPEQLTCESPEEAIEEWLSSRYCPDTEADIAAKCPLYAIGYTRRKIDCADDYAESIVERLREDLGDEYGDPDGDHDILSAEVEATLTAEITAAIEKAFASAVSWQCEPAERREFKADDVIALYRKLRDGRP